MPDERPITAGDIRWTIDPPMTLADTAVLDPVELCLAREAFRCVAVAGLHHGHALHRENLRLKRELVRLRDELSARREESRRVRAQADLIDV